MNSMQTTATTQIPAPLIPGMATEPGISPETPLGRLLGISSKLMDGLWFCPAIPPELCGELSEASKDYNRKQNPEHSKLIASAMKAGRWIREVGCDIHFHRDGWLANGQHRLAGAHKANIPFYAIIHTNLDSRAVAALDQGKKRSVSDVLAISFGSKEGGVKKTCAVTAMMQYEAGDVSFRVKIDPYEVGLQVMSLTEAQEKIINISDKISRHLGMLHSVTAGVCLVFQKKQPNVALQFLEDILSGLTVDATEPAYLFRQYMISAKNSDRAGGKGKKWSRYAYGQMLIRAINLKTSGAKVTKLQAGKGLKVDLLVAPVLKAKNKQVAPLLEAVK